MRLHPALILLSRRRVVEEDVVGGAVEVVSKYFRSLSSASSSPRSHYDSTDSTSRVKVQPH